MCYRVNEIPICRLPTPAARECLRAGLKVEGIIRTKDVELWQEHAKEIVKTWLINQ